MVRAPGAEEVGLRVERDPAGNLLGVPDARAAVVGRRLAPGQRARRRALRRPAGRVRARSRWRERRRADGRDRVRRRGGRALQHADVRQQGAGRRARLPAVLDRAATTTACAWPTRCAPPASIPSGVAQAPAWLGRLRGFLELHIDQTPDLEPASPGRERAGGADARRGRPRTGAPTTPARRRRDERRDALAARRAPRSSPPTSARTDDMVVTTSRILVEPNALTTIAVARAPVDRRALGGPAIGARPPGSEDLRRPGAELSRRRRARTASSSTAQLRAPRCGDPERRRVLRRPRRRHPGRRDPGGDGARAQPQRHQPLAGGARRPRRRRPPRRGAAHRSEVVR